jgi:chemotaxis protein MotA
MDIATIIGILFGIFCTVVSILLGGSILAFVDAPSVFVVIGGGLASTLISYRISEIKSIMKVVSNAFFHKNHLKKLFSFW